jgi:HAMP domain-containing protein
MAMFMSTDTNGFLSDYMNQEASARRKRALSRAQYDYGAQELSRNASQSLRDIGQKYSQGMEPAVTAYTGRGLGRSGIFQRAMKNYVEAQQRDINDVYRQVQSGMGQLAMGENEAGAALQDELDRIARMKNQEILNAAVELKNWAPYAGAYSGGG